MLQDIKKNLAKLNYVPTSVQLEDAAADYNGAKLIIDQSTVYYRQAKITPTKIGMFVTFWKRDRAGITVPYDESDDFDRLMIFVQDKNRSGVFLFSKQLLLEQQYCTYRGVEGKRGFRVYPSWVSTQNPQATKTQAWQMKYFKELD